MHRPNRFTLWNIYQELLRNFTFRGERPDHMVQYWNWPPFQQQARRGVREKRCTFYTQKQTRRWKQIPRFHDFFPLTYHERALKKKVLFSYVIRSGQYKNHILRNKPVTGSMKINYVPTHDYLLTWHTCFYHTFVTIAYLLGLSLLRASSGKSVNRWHHFMI